MPHPAAPGGPRPRRRALLAAALLPLALLAAGRVAPALAQQTLGRVVLLCPDDAPPYCLPGKDGRAAGLLPDFWSLYSRRSGQEVEVRLAPGAEVLERVARGEADGHAGLSLPEDPAQLRAFAERFAPTQPLLDPGLAVFVPAEAPANAAQDAGLIGGGGLPALLAAAYPALRQRVYPDLDGLAAALVLGHVRVAAAPRLPLLHRLRAMGASERFTLAAHYPGAPLRAGLRLGDASLLARLNAGLEALPPEEVQALAAPYVWKPSGRPAWSLVLGLCLAVAGLAGGGLLLLRARRVRDSALASIREAEHLRDNLLGEMGRHRKTQDLLLSAIEQSPSGFIIGFAGREAPPVFNAQSLRILGVEPPAPGRLPHDPEWRVYTAAGQLLPHTELPLARTLARGEGMVNEELRLVLRSGEERWILTNAAPVRDAQGRVRAGVVVFHDVTVLRQAERDLARFKFFLEAGVEEVYLVRPAGTLAYVNEAVARSLGHARQELLDAPLADIDPAFTPDAVYRLLLTVRRGPHTFETTQRTRDGRPVLKEIKAFYMRFGEDEYVCAFGRDITEKNRLQGELLRTRALFQASLEQAPWGIVLGDAATGKVTNANPAAARLLGVERETLVGLDVDTHLPIWSVADAQGRSVPSPRSLLGLAVRQGEESRGVEFLLRIQHGPERWLLADASPVRDGEGNIVAGILIMADISARKQLEEELRRKALRDALTGLPNRARCLELLEGMLAAPRRDGQAFAVAFLDLDRFKMLNDSLGHSFGDRVLCEAAQRLEQALDGRGAVCRFGGDEFVLLLDAEEDAARAQERVRQALLALSRPMGVEGQELRLTASAGLVIGPDLNPGAPAPCNPDPLPEGEAPTPEQILQRADLAMHRAKDAGRDRLRLFHPGMLRRARALMALDADMRRGLEQGEFLAFYQPIVSTADGSLLGLEALARWRSPARGLVQPRDFIPHAEDSGLILPLGRQVLLTACGQMAAWRRRFPAARRLTLAVNLSALQFGQPDLVESVRQVLRDTGLPPALLKLELTESTLMGDPEGALAAMRRLKALGLSLAIDDFGTGYSSLAYLQRFPVDVLKIDRSFVRGLGSGGDDGRALVGAMAALAGSLRLGVVAEGVETAGQLELLRSIGCEAVQGFLFHPPLPAEAVEELLDVEEG